MFKISHQNLEPRLIEKENNLRKIFNRSTKLLKKDLYRKIFIKPLMKGMWSVFTTLIILLATVVLSIMVAFFAFSMLGSQAHGTIVTQASPGIIKDGNLCVSIRASSSIKIVELEVENYTESLNVCLNPGTNNVVLPLPSGFSPVKCVPYSFTLVLSNGKSVIISAEEHC